MKPKGLRVLLTLLAVAILALLTNLWVRDSQPANTPLKVPPVKLPDGTVLTLQKVTLGTEHEYEYGSAFGEKWQTIAPRLPKQLSDRIRIPARETIKSSTTNTSWKDMSYTSGGGSPNNNSITNSFLTLWFHRTAAPTNVFQSEDTYLTVAEGSGSTHLPKSYPCWFTLQSGFNAERLEEHRFQAFPRRAEMLTISVYSVGLTNGNRQLVLAGTFKIPNPACGPFPVWQPESLPIVRQNGDLEFSLTRLKVRKDAPGEARDLTRPVTGGTETAFQVTRNGAPAPEWQVESLRLTDTTGNLLYFWSGANDVSNGVFFARRYWLDPQEPAWKVCAEFSHKAGFGTEEMATIKNVPINLNRETYEKSPNWSVKVKGVNLSIRAVKRESGWGGNATLEIGATPKTGVFRIALVKATDDQGRQIAIPKPPGGQGDFIYPSLYYGLELPDDSTSLDLTFAYQESRFAEFIAKPEVETNQSPR